MKTFKGHIESKPIFTTYGKLKDFTEDDDIDFTENQILLPDRLKNKFSGSNIRDGDTYKLNSNKNIDRNLRYQIVLNNGVTIRLYVDRKNERKLKRIHKLNWYSKLPIKYDIIKMAITKIRQRR